MNSKIWTTNVEVDEDGEYLLTFPPELLEHVGWNIGDVLDWTDNKDGTFTIKRKDDE